jgi:multidrug efflux pump subunit AcrB
MIELRNKVEANVPGLKIETAQLIEDMIGDLTAVPQPIEIKIFGSNQDELTPIANMITDKISTISGVVEVTNGIVYSGDDIDIKIDQVKAALVGLDPDSINRQLGNQIVGVQVNQILLKNKIIPIRIMADANLHQRIEQLNGLMLRSIDGKYISLNQVATIEIHAGQAEQTREDLKPMLAVKGRIEGRGFGTTMADIKKAIKEINLPNGVYIEYGGLYQQQQQAFFDLMIVFISAELLVCVMLMILYEDVCIVLSILVTTLLTLPGIFIGLFITNTELNISSMMGMTMVIGIVTEIAFFILLNLIY